MIVMGSHGRTGIAHILPGSVSEKVVRKASCTALIVKQSGHKFAMP
jgi:nucleotide-binding universal stress UspA family protein